MSSDAKEPITYYTRPEGVMGGACLHCQGSQPEHVGLTCQQVRENRRKEIRSHMESARSQPPRIVCAALLLTGGFVVCSPRHYDKRMRSVIDAAKLDIRGATEGFIDQYGNFHDRAAAWHIAVLQKQIRRSSPHAGERLYSENLY